ncbi:MAG TPA: hypothetical protein VFC63_05040 [Blastocatellia bacterium]|nr:hypothetical protein [Blastocatellia bacterium]
MSASLPPATTPDLYRYQNHLFVIGVIALILCAIGAIFNFDQFLHSYLMAYVFWIGVALGSLAILMMQHLTGGAWGLLLRRALESATRTLPAMIILFIPLLFGLHRLYIWTHSAEVAANPLLQHKHAYLNTPFFIIRAAGYFVIWILLIALLNRWSLRQDKTGEPRLALKMQHLSGPGLFILAITLSLALIDWVMSLEPEWYSTMYAVIYMAGDMLAAFAFTIGVIILLADRKPLSDVITPDHFRDLGNLILTFVMLWAYTSFAQFLLIWSGNLRDETPWYLSRTMGGWGWIAGALIVFHFFLPFFMLLGRSNKKNPKRLAVIALIVFFMRLVDVFWLVEPAFHPGNFHLSWMDIIAPIGIGGIWMALFIWFLKSRPILPLQDPYAEETFNHAGD